MGELFKTQHTIDEMLDRMGVQIVLNGDHLSEEDKKEAEKHGDIIKVSSEKENQQKSKE